MASRLIRTADDLDALFTLLGKLKLPATISWVLGLNRSLQQNRLQHLWAREAADQRGDTTPEEARCEWKLQFGVPILREEDAEFHAFYDSALKPLPYPMKLKAMRLVAVTSKMNVRQMIKYLDAVERECLEQGIVLTAPDPDLAAYHNRYRMKDAA